MNFQNVPRDDPVVKRAIIPKRGSFSMFDYSQIEPRFFAYFAATGLKDTTIAEWYREGRDVYVEIAARAHGKPAAQITKDERQLGKRWFLMSLYGAGPAKMGKEIGMPLKEAKAFYRAFHEGLPQIKSLSNPKPSRPDIPWEPGMIERVYKRRGFLRTPHGRQLHHEEWKEYALLNKLIQGSAADLMKASLLRIDAWLRAHPEVQSRMVSVIHDEVIFDGPESELPLLHTAVPPLMCEDWLTAVVPIEVDHEVSILTWADKIDYTTYLAAEWMAAELSSAQTEEVAA